MATREERREQYRDRVIEVRLSRGMTALVDIIDADLALLKWTAVPKRQNWYAFRHGPKPQSAAVYLHREIARRMGLGIASFHVDHIDRNGLNCRRSNLRPVTHSQNARNGRLKQTNSSGFRGVWWHAQAHRWSAQIRANGKRINLGCFDSAEEAAMAYAKAAADLHGGFAYADEVD